MFGMDETTRATGDLVILKNVAQGRSLFRGGIHLPFAPMENEKMVKAIVLSVGPDAAKEGITVGDKVFYDKHSIFSEKKVGTDDEGEVVITKVENIIGIFTEEN